LQKRAFHSVTRSLGRLEDQRDLPVPALMDMLEEQSHELGREVLGAHGPLPRPALSCARVLNLIDEGDLVLLQKKLWLDHSHAWVLDNDHEGDVARRHDGSCCVIYIFN